MAAVSRRQLEAARPLSSLFNIELNAQHFSLTFHFRLFTLIVGNGALDARTRERIRKSFLHLLGTDIAARLHCVRAGELILRQDLSTTGGCR